MTPGTWLVFMGARFMALGLPQFYEIRFWDETLVSSIFHKQQVLSKFQPFRICFLRAMDVHRFIGSVDGW
jgi:hypothetical protein